MTRRGLFAYLVGAAVAVPVVALAQSPSKILPMSLAQQREALAWMLDLPSSDLKAWGLDDPINIEHFRTQLALPQ